MEMGGSEIQSVSDLRAQRACAHLTARNLKRARHIRGAASLLSLLCSSPPCPSFPPISPASYREMGDEAGEWEGAEMSQLSLAAAMRVMNAAASPLLMTLRDAELRFPAKADAW